jgi:CheY-like chemotaxis protein
VICLGSGEEAVTYPQDHAADFILLDMIMALSIDGLETYKRILEINPREKAIIVSSQVMTDRIKGA